MIRKKQQYRVAFMSYPHFWAVLGLIGVKVRYKICVCVHSYKLKTSICFIFFYSEFHSSMFLGSVVAKATYEVKLKAKVFIYLVRVSITVILNET